VKIAADKLLEKDAAKSPPRKAAEHFQTSTPVQQKNAQIQKATSIFDSSHIDILFPMPSHGPVTSSFHSFPSGNMPSQGFTTEGNKSSLISSLEPDEVAKYEMLDYVDIPHLKSEQKANYSLQSTIQQQQNQNMNRRSSMPEMTPSVTQTQPNYYNPRPIVPPFAHNMEPQSRPSPSPTNSHKSTSPASQVSVSNMRPIPSPTQSPASMPSRPAPSPTNLGPGPSYNKLKSPTNVPPPSAIPQNPRPIRASTFSNANVVPNQNPKLGAAYSTPAKARPPPPKHLAPVGGTLPHLAKMKTNTNPLAGSGGPIMHNRGFQSQLPVQQSTSMDSMNKGGSSGGAQSMQSTQFSTCNRTSPTAQIQGRGVAYQSPQVMPITSVGNVTMNNNKEANSMRSPTGVAGPAPLNQTNASNSNASFQNSNQMMMNQQMSFQGMMQGTSNGASNSCSMGPHNNFQRYGSMSNAGFNNQGLGPVNRAPSMVMNSNNASFQSYGSNAAMQNQMRPFNMNNMSQSMGPQGNFQGTQMQQRMAGQQSHMGSFPMQQSQQGMGQWGSVQPASDPRAAISIMDSFVSVPQTNAWPSNNQQNLQHGAQHQMNNQNLQGNALQMFMQYPNNQQAMSQNMNPQQQQQQRMSMQQQGQQQQQQPRPFNSMQWASQGRQNPPH